MTGKRNEPMNQTHLEIFVKNGNNHGEGLQSPMHEVAPLVQELEYQDRILLDGAVNQIAAKVKKLGEIGSFELVSKLALFLALGGGSDDGKDRADCSFYHNKRGKTGYDVDLRLAKEKLYE